MDTDSILDRIWNALLRVRNEKPLINQITNHVSSRVQAGITLSAGAVPVMAEHRDGLEDILSAAGALLLNTGTLNRDRSLLIEEAAKIARQYRVPVVLDPVGIGASRPPRKLTKRLIKGKRVDIVRGNPGEIFSLVARQFRESHPEFKQGITGVDFISDIDYINDYPELVKYIGDFARENRLVVAMSGEKDLITDGKPVIIIENGTDLFEKISGAGCMLGSLIAALLAVNGDKMIAAVGGSLIMGIAGELAVEKASGPGSFDRLLLDEVYNLNENAIRKRAKIYLE